MNNELEKAGVEDDSHLEIIELLDEKGVNNEDDVILSPIEKMMEYAGMIKYARTIGQFNNVMMLVKLKKAQLLFRKKDPGALMYAKSFPEFCKKLGLNYNTIREHLHHLELFGYNFMEKMETMGLPIRDMRMLCKLNSDRREVAIRMIMNSDNGEMAKDVIRDLMAENVKMRDTLDEASMKVKAKLIEERDNQKREYKSEYERRLELEAKLDRKNERIKKLLASREPKERVKAMRSISRQVEKLLDCFRASENVETTDEEFEAEQEKLRRLINRAGEILRV